MENLNKRPSKGILRFSEGSSRSNSVEKDIKWDENNIKETLHPDDKDYGYMKIDEPPTPYSRSPHGLSGENSDEEEGDGNRHNTTDLLEKVSKRIKEPPVTLENVEGLLDESDLDAIVNDGDDVSATEHQQEDDDDGDNDENGANRMMVSMNTSSASTPSVASTSRSPRVSTDGSAMNVSDFELKRKRHYNEFYAVKLAKKLMEKELKDEESGDVDEAETDDNKEEGKIATSDGT